LLPLPSVVNAARRYPTVAGYTLRPGAYPMGAGLHFSNNRHATVFDLAPGSCYEPYPQRLPLLLLIVKEPGSWSRSFSRSAATRVQVVRHSFCVMWVAASQSLKQVVSQKATRSFISWMSLADFDGCGVDGPAIDTADPGCGASPPRRRHNPAAASGFVWAIHPRYKSAGARF